MRISITPHSHQPVVVLVFLMLAILVGRFTDGWMDDRQTDRQYSAYILLVSYKWLWFLKSVATLLEIKIEVSSVCLFFTTMF